MDGRFSRLQFITHHTDTIGYIESAALALSGGCRWIQLRMKDAAEEEFLSAAHSLRRLCDSHGARLILDDRVDLVVASGADGVHLGKNDMPVDEARKLLGDRYIIGGTANTIEDIRMHWRNGADYIGCGPFRFTETKKNLAPILGIEGYRSILQTMKAEGIRLPLVAIGGIEAGDIRELMDAGVYGIALSGTVLRAADPVAETRRIIALTEDKIQ